MNNNVTANVPAKVLKPTDGRECAGAAPMDTLTELMDIAAARAADVLQMAYRINLHLFGIDNREDQKEVNPTCFMDVLYRELALLNKTGEELAKLMEKLGC